MMFPIKTKCKITSTFDEMRPLNNPHRPHGAWDMGCPTGTVIYAPERGDLLWHVRLRVDTGKTHGGLRWPGGDWYAWSNYYYDWAGGLAALHGDSGYTHVWLHFEVNEILARLAEGECYHVWYENKEDDAMFWTISNMKAMKRVGEGAAIGHSGEAGTITGPHVHYEIHKKQRWIPHAQRPRPGVLYPEIKQHEGVI